MKKVLIVFAHPFPNRSRANRLILERISNIPQATVSDLYEKYPYFQIDVAREQQLLVSHDIIFFQHPFYWYSIPPLLKQWFDDVFTVGFAYGPGGDKLKGKLFFQSFTTGGPLESYSDAGYNNYSVEDFLPPFKQTAKLCEMKWIPPLVLHHVNKASREIIEAHGEFVREKLIELSVKKIEGVGLR